MRWQWPVRIVAAVVGIGCAIAIYLSAHGRPQPADPPKSLARIDPNQTLEGGAGRTDYTKVGRNPVKVLHEHIGKNTDGRQWFSGVQIDGLQEQRYSIHGDRLETEGPEDRPSRLNISGHVVIVMDDGLHLNADNATYEDASGQLMMPGPVTFTRGRLSGAATGAAYDSKLDAITLLSAASAKVLPDETGKGSADATAARMRMVRGQHALTLDGNAKIVGDTQVLTGQQAAIQFTDDEHAIKTLDLKGAARVTPKPGASSADQPDMSAETIAMAFQPDGVSLQHATLTDNAVLLMTGAATRSIKASKIDFATAPDGKTLTQLDAGGQVQVDVGATPTTRGRVITADTMTARGDEKKGLTSARFDGSPVFREVPDAPPAGSAAGAAPAAGLEGKARSLVLKLAGQLDAIESADFDQQAKFVNGDATARGDRGVYEQASGTVHLTPNTRDPRVQSHAETGDMTIDAWNIDLLTTTQDLKAWGSVTTRTRAHPDASSSGGSLFGSDKSSNGSADKFDYVKSTGKGTYRGDQMPARLWQAEGSSILAAQIVFTDSTRNLQASGSVDSTWPFDSPADSTAAPGRKAEVKNYRVRADTLDYDDAARTATFKAPVVFLTLPDGGAVESRLLIFKLAAASRSLDEMRAEQGVWIKQGEYEGDADRFVYHADTDTYDFYGRTGREAILKSPENTSDHPEAAPTSCTRTVGMHLILQRKEGSVIQPGQGEAFRPSTHILCSVSIRRDR